MEYGIILVQAFGWIGLVYGSIVAIGCVIYPLTLIGENPKDHLKEENVPPALRIYLVGISYALLGVGLLHLTEYLRGIL